VCQYLLKLYFSSKVLFQDLLETQEITSLVLAITASTEKAWTQLFFVPDLFEYAFVGVSLSDAKFMGGEYSNESRNEIY